VVSILSISDVLYWLQLKFFIISYVNSLERRKYVAVLFSWTQERIKCLPAQYSCIHTTYTVNPFVKNYNAILLSKYDSAEKKY
jgi:hypothetical protein